MNSPDDMPLGTGRPASVAVLLTMLIDEMHETTALLRVLESARPATRPWWRTVRIITTQQDILAGFAAQYLGENIKRACDHWRAVLSLVEQLRMSAQPDDRIAILADGLKTAGLFDVLPQLGHGVIPGPPAQAATHLAAVVDRIRDCNRLTVRTSALLALDEMRQRDSGFG